MKVFNNMAWGTQIGLLQSLFDCKVTDSGESHELWRYAWGKAIAYAWKSEENKKNYSKIQRLYYSNLLTSARL